VNTDWTDWGQGGLAAAAVGDASRLGNKIRALCEQAGYSPQDPVFEAALAAAQAEIEQFKRSGETALETPDTVAAQLNELIEASHDVYVKSGEGVAIAFFATQTSSGSGQLLLTPGFARIQKVIRDYQGKTQGPRMDGYCPKLPGSKALPFCYLGQAGVQALVGDAKRTIAERFSKLGSLKTKEDAQVAIEGLAAYNPLALGKVLLEEPFHARNACRLLAGMAAREKEAKVLDGIVFWGGAGLATLSIATGVGAGIGAAYFFLAGNGGNGRSRIDFGDGIGGRRHRIDALFWRGIDRKSRGCGGTSNHRPPRRVRDSSVFARGRAAAGRV
jgi:hypothetical protein